MSAQEHPRAIFHRAVEWRSLIVAEGMARDMGTLTLEESLAPTALAAEKSDGKRSRYAVRRLRRLLEEDANLTIDEAVLAASALASLSGRSHEQAHATLTAGWEVGDTSSPASG